MSELIEPELYVCRSCAKEKDYLPESWHVVELSSFEFLKPKKLYFCLECISDKREWRAR